MDYEETLVHEDLWVPLATPGLLEHQAPEGNLDLLELLACLGL